jgi:membrane peptidoglycan carboxypeptidase
LHKFQQDDEYTTMTGKSSFFKRFATIIGSLVGMLALAGLAGALIASLTLPAVLAARGGLTIANASLLAPQTINLAELSQKTTIYAKDGDKDVVLANFYAQDRDLISFKDLSKTVINTTLAAEDVRYYQHGAIEPQSLARAAIKGGGGSTIAMQYVKNVCIQQAELLDTQKAVVAAYNKCVQVSPGRKLADIRGAIALEKKYSKNSILAAYLNIASFGGRVYGIEAAARYYYGVHSDKLSVAQAASLLAIVNEPTTLRIDIKDNLPANKVRRDYILNNMYKNKLITKAELTTALNTQIKTHITEAPTGCMQASSNAGFFCDYVVNELLTNPIFGATSAIRYRNLQSAGWQIHTTLNMKLQKSAQKTISTYVPKTLSAFRIGSAASSIQVGTGRILAMVQSKKYNNTAEAGKGETSVNYNAGYNSTGFQPGSTYKVFTLLDWIKSGYTLSDSVNGSARTIPANNFTQCGVPYQGSPWTFGNDEAESGYMSVLTGTKGSVNGAFASMATQLDLCDIRALAEGYGVESSDGSPLKDNPPSVIGGASSVPPMSMTAAFAGVANNGVYCSPIAIDSITTLTGKSVDVPQKDCKRVTSTGVTKTAKIALHAVITGGTMGGDQTPDSAVEYGKTGTTDSAVQTWVMGTTKKVTTGVWVGNVSGHTNLRQIYSTPYCGLKGSSQAAIERHCIWRGIQTVANKLYGY